MTDGRSENLSDNDRTLRRWRRERKPLPFSRAYIMPTTFSSRHKSYCPRTDTHAWIIWFFRSRNRRGGKKLIRCVLTGKRYPSRITLTRLNILIVLFSSRPLIGIKTRVNDRTEKFGIMILLLISRARYRLNYAIITIIRQYNWSYHGLVAVYKNIRYRRQTIPGRCTNDHFHDPFTREYFFL